MYGVTESEKFHILPPVALLHGMHDGQRDEILRDYAKVNLLICVGLPIPIYIWSNPQSFYSSFLLTPFRDILISSKSPSSLWSSRSWIFIYSSLLFSIPIFTDSVSRLDFQYFLPNCSILPRNARILDSSILRIRGRILGRLKSFGTRFSQNFPLPENPSRDDFLESQRFSSIENMSSGDARARTGADPVESAGAIRRLFQWIHERVRHKESGHGARGGLRQRHRGAVNNDCQFAFKDEPEELHVRLLASESYARLLWRK